MGLAATLAIMVGGPTEALEKVRPVFQAMGKTITHVGEAGAGQIAKAANQIMVAAQMVAMGELLVFARKAGADPQKVVEAIKVYGIFQASAEVKDALTKAGKIQ